MKIPFKQNVGMLDRCFRICVGTGLIVLGSLFMMGTIRDLLMILGMLLLVSGVLGFCPSYFLLGISTVREGGCC
ncbi:MAG: DUF2892 domain-containing protein [bacterium]